MTQRRIDEKSLKSGTALDAVLRFRFVLPVVFGCLLALPASHAYAQCETPSNATNEFNDLADDIVDELNDFITQEENFITELVTHRAKYEMINRLYEFDTTIRAGLTNWWNNDLLPAMKQQSQQLSADQVDQSKTLGALLDAQSENEALNDINQQEVESKRRYEPNESSCTVDSIAAPAGGGGGGATKAATLSKAVAKGFAQDDEPRRANSKGSPSEFGTGAEQQWAWTQFKNKFCDPGIGHQGCTVAGVPQMSGMHANLPKLLWGNKQTIDMNNAKNREIVEAAQRYYINPNAGDPVPDKAVKSTTGQEILLERRANSARLNTVYNVIGGMVAERIGGSGVNTQDVRVAAGLPPGDAATDASYRELMQAMSVDRYHDPQYIVRMVNYPEQTVRELGSINAIKMQQMIDIYRRQEELMFMEAASYANVLDGDKPGTSAASAPLR